MSINLLQPSSNFKTKFLLCFLILHIRTKKGNNLCEVDLPELKSSAMHEELKFKNVQVIKLLDHLNQSIAIQEVKPVFHPMASEKIATYDKVLNKPTFTFGIIYQKVGQVTEKEIFDNREHSKEFEDFLNFIGTRVKLKNFSGLVFFCCC